LRKFRPNPKGDRADLASPRRYDDRQVRATGVSRDRAVRESGSGPSALTCSTPPRSVSVRNCESTNDSFSRFRQPQIVASGVTFSGLASRQQLHVVKLPLAANTAPGIISSATDVKIADPFSNVIEPSDPFHGPRHDPVLEFAQGRWFDAYAEDLLADSDPVGELRCLPPNGSRGPNSAVLRAFRPNRASVQAGRLSCQHSGHNCRMPLVAKLYKPSQARGGKHYPWTPRSNCTGSHRSSLRFHHTTFIKPFRG